MNLAMQLLVAGHSSTATNELTPPQEHSSNPFLTTDGSGKYILNWANGDGVYSGCVTDIHYNGSKQAESSAGTPGQDDTHPTGSSILPTNAFVHHRDPDGRESDDFGGGGA